jgi:surfeit locus 1 family protein
MKKIPILASIVTALCVAAMIALGIWQLQRADQKAALLARFNTNLAMSSEVAFPAVSNGESDLLFRRAAGFCLEPLLPVVEGGRSAKGVSGWRHIVSCRTGAEGPGMMVDIGWSKDFAVKPGWKGGEVRGVISLAPDHRSLIAKLMGRGQSPGLILIATEPVRGLAASAPPNPADVPNNHLSYAVQWFLFAGIAALIFGLALRRRWKT